MHPLKQSAVQFYFSFLQFCLYHSYEIHLWLHTISSSIRICGYAIGQKNKKQKKKQLRLFHKNDLSKTPYLASKAKPINIFPYNTAFVAASDLIKLLFPRTGKVEVYSHLPWIYTHSYLKLLSLILDNSTYKWIPFGKKIWHSQVKLLILIPCYWNHANCFLISILYQHRTTTLIHMHSLAYIQLFSLL